MDFNKLPDYPVFKKLAAALWRTDNANGGAAVMVGSGFSRCATDNANSKMPLWSDFTDRVKMALNINATEHMDALKVAEEYRVNFSQNSLNDAIEQVVQDKNWEPNELYAQGGSIKATSKGNLPTKLVRAASEMLPEFAVAKLARNISISEFAGSNEDKFNALHYTRVLAGLSGIVYLRSGKLHFKKSALKTYQQKGISAFFLPMLEAATIQYNWSYMDGFSDEFRLETFWLFMLWRLQFHGDFARLFDEVLIAFTMLIEELPNDSYCSKEALLMSIIETRFLSRFLQYWGFVTVESKWFADGERVPSKVNLLPLMKQCFIFSV